MQTTAIRRAGLSRLSIIALIVVALGAALLATTTIRPTASEASSHREAPLIAGDPRADNTDVYAFVSPDDPDSVTLIASWIPFEEPDGGPNFYAWAENARYNIKIDNDGDALPDLIYEWTFTNVIRNDQTFLYNTGPVTSLTDETLNFYQTYDLNVIALTDGVEDSTTLLLDDAISAPSLVGKGSIPDYAPLSEEAIYPLPSEGGQSWVGQSDDPFFLDLRVFDLLYGADLSQTGIDTLSGYNVNTIALEVPTDALLRYLGILFLGRVRTVIIDEAHMVE